MAIKANLVIDQGATFAATVDVEHANGTPFDLTDYTVAAQARKNYASSTAITFTTYHTGANAEIIMTLSANTTSNIEPGRYLYDVESTSTVTGAVDRVIEGIVTVTPGITRV